ncbi:MAG: hypothetical protein ABIP51_10270 [Bacteroidia bacterium]
MVTKEMSLDELRIEIQKATNEAWERENSVEIIITYDCLESNFRNRLRDELLIKKYKAMRLSESTYHLKKKYTYTQINSLVEEIFNLFKEEVINESKKAIPNSIVRLVFPNGKEFLAFDIDLKS